MFGDFENIQIGATDRYWPANQIGVYWVETEQHAQLAITTEKMGRVARVFCFWFCSFINVIRISGQLARLTIQLFVCTTFLITIKSNTSLQTQFERQI